MQRASARGRVNCAGNGGCAAAAGALLMEEEILRLNNCLSLQLGDGHKPKRTQVFGQRNPSLGAYESRFWAEGSML